MKRKWKTIVILGAVALACMALDSSTAKAQNFNFGYSGPGVSVGVNAGNYGYFGGGGYYGGGYYGGYPVLAPRAFIPGPVVGPGYVRGPILGGPVVYPRAYGYARPIARYRPYPGYYRRGWW
jgi:hypothetical protein